MYFYNLMTQLSRLAGARHSRSKG